MKTHNNNFNFLRLVLANLVLLAHAPELIDGNRSREILTRLGFSLSFGELAVAGFFILSGYLIVQSWTRRPQPVHFLKQRMKRIIPGFVVASLISAFIVGAIGVTDSHSYWAKIDGVAYIKSLIALSPPATPPTFEGQPYQSVNGSMWTIYYEFRCYLVVLLAGMLLILRGRYLWVIGTMLLIAVCFIDQNGFPRWQVPGYRLFLIAYFAAGGSFFILRNRIKFNRPLIIIAIVALIAGLLSKHTELVALCVAGAYLLFALAFTSIPSLSWFNTMPDVSYGAYLYGWPIQKLVIWFFPMISPWVLFPISVCLALVAGAASWFAVEKWFMRNSRPLNSALKQCSNL